MSGGLAGFRASVGVLHEADELRTRRKEGVPVGPVALAVDNLRGALGPGGWHRPDIMLVCDAAERETNLRLQLRAIGNYAREAVQGVPREALLEMIEDALGEEFSR